MIRVLKRLIQEEAGQDLIEYALIGVIISLSAVVAMGSLASSINNEYVRLANGLSY